MLPFHYTFLLFYFMTVMNRYFFILYTSQFDIIIIFFNFSTFEDQQKLALIDNYHICMVKLNHYGKDKSLVLSICKRKKE